MEMEEDQAAGLRNANSLPGSISLPRRLRCIGVGSGKGGVGKTVISIGIASRLAELKYRTLLLDADLGLANVDIQMGIEPEMTLQDIIYGNASFEQVVIHTENGPDLLPGGSGAQELVEMSNVRRQAFVEDLVKFAAQYDFLVIDAGAGIGRSTTAFLSACPEVIVVVANEPTSIMDAYSLIKVLSMSEIPPSMKLAINMVRTIDEGEMLAERLNKIVRQFLGLQLPVAGIVVRDDSVPDSIRARRPIMKYSAGSAPAHCIRELGSFLASGRNQGIPGAKVTMNFFEKLAETGIRSEQKDKSR